MLYRRLIPSPPLDAFVDCLWYSEGLQGTHARERLLPNGESGIVFDLRERSGRIRLTDHLCEQATYAPAVFCGARTDSFLLDTSEQERVIGIQFRTGGAFPFLSMPASDVANTTYSLHDLWPSEALLIHEQLLAASSVNTMFVILQRALLTRLHLGRFLHPSVVFAVRQLSDISGAKQFKDVVERIGLSSRHFIDLFRQQTGLTPKAYQRVRRFQSVLQTLRRDADTDGASLAASSGYYDQAHFIHDFKHFSGLTPTDYARLATPHLNHIPLI